MTLLLNYEEDYLVTEEPVDEGRTGSMFKQLEIYSKASSLNLMKVEFKESQTYSLKGTLNILPKTPSIKYEITGSNLFGYSRGDKRHILQRMRDAYVHQVPNIQQLVEADIKRIIEADIKEEDIKVFIGEVERIENDIAILSLKNESDYFEYEIGIKQLSAAKVDYEGAPIKLLIKEIGNKTLIELEARPNVSPLWDTPDEEVIQIFRDLKKSSQKKK
jgi:hypothetical protein